MLRGASRTLSGDDSFHPFSPPGIDHRNWKHSFCIFFSHFTALLWMEFIDRMRKSRSLLVDLLSPALMILVLAYAVGLSPVYWIEPFQYSSLPEVTFQKGIPNESFRSSVWKEDMTTVNQWLGVFEELNMTLFFVDYIVTLAKVRNSTGPYNKYRDAKMMSSLLLTEDEVIDTLLVNRYAAAPFKVPTFDGYTSMIDTARMTIGEQGLKHTMHNDPLIYFVIRFGKLAFAIGDGGGSELTTAAEKLIEYLNATSKSFGSTIVCQYDIVSTGKNGCVFDSVNRAFMLLTSSTLQGQMLWAIVRLDFLSTQPLKFHYTIFLNDTVVRDRVTMETYPQGLGKEYANYAYNGVLTLQYELNNYFLSLAITKRPQPSLSLTPLMNSICGFVSTPHNATKNMFEESTNTTDRAIVEKAAAEHPIMKVYSQSFTDVNAIYVPCLFEIGAFCQSSNDTDSLLKCLKTVETEKNMSVVCRSALEFVHTCLPTAAECKVKDTYQLLTKVPSVLPQCAESVAATCVSNSFLHEVNRTKSVLKCASDLERVCRWEQNTDDFFYACRKVSTEVIKTLSDDCSAVLESFLPCSDEYQSICPMKRVGKKVNIPYACLYKNRRLLSASCKTTRFVKDILPNLFTQKAVLEEVFAATHYCREVHDIYKTLTNSVVVQAFPTNGYNQRMFFLSGGRFVGLVLAVAYYFPFAAIVQSIAHEWESCQRKYLVIIGTYPLAILCSKFFAGFVVSLVTSFLVTFVMAFFIIIPSSTLFGLLNMYSLSLSTLALVIGALAPGERVATILTPFIHFLFVASAFFDNQTDKFSGFSMLLPPTVFFRAINQYMQAAQSDYIYVTMPYAPSRPLWIMFGLFLMYGMIAVVLEYLYLPNSPLERVFQRVTASCLNFTHRLLQRRYRRVVVYYEGEEMSSRCRSAFDTQGGNEATTQREAQVRSHGYNIGGISNTTTGKTEKQEGQVDMFNVPDVASRENQFQVSAETLASLMSSEAAPIYTSPSCTNETPTAVPQNWLAAITVRNLCYATFGKGPNLRISSANFYRNRLNCVVGGANCGKSLLLELLTGESDVSQGEIRVDGVNLWSGRRGDFGVCFEKSVFWKNLSVSENIRLVQLIKGRVKEIDELRNEEDILLSALQLTSVRHERAGRLTGGVSRKLAVAMALAGGSRTLFFDEPTASTDLLSRREIWHLLSQNTKGRCIVISTSDVEEVDMFADHVTVLFEGRVSVAGTPEYIKRKLSGGWVVTVCRAERTKIETIVSRVLAVAPDAIILSNVGYEISFRLTENVAEQFLPVLFTELTRAREVGLITNISVSDARLAEAFVRLTRVLDLREPQETSDEVTTVSMSNGNYVMLPPSTQNEMLGEEVVEGPAIGTSEERVLRGKKIFTRGYRAALSYRTFDAFLSPIHACIVIMIPLVMILLMSTFSRINTDVRSISESFSILDWQLSSKASNSFYIDLGGTDSPYKFLKEQIVGKKIAKTLSYLSLLNDAELSLTERNSVGMGNFLKAHRFPEGTFDFGAFALQGPVVRTPDVPTYPQFFPWVADVVLCNTSFPLSVPSYLELLGMMRLWVATNETIGIINTSLGSLRELEYGDKHNRVIISKYIDIMSTLLLLLPFAFYGSRMVSYLVQQRQSGLLQILYSSSLRADAFWLANFTYDFLSFMLLAFLGLTIYAAMNFSLSSNWWEFFRFMGLAAVFGCSTISLSYLFSRYFTDAIAAQNFVTLFNIFTGFAFLVASSVIRFLPDNPLTLAAKAENENYSALMRFFPLFNLGEAFMNRVMTFVSDSGMEVVFRLQPLMLLLVIFIAFIIYETLVEVEVYVFLRNQSRRLFNNLFKKMNALLYRLCGGGGGSEYVDEPMDRWEDPSFLLAGEDVSVVEERARANPCSDLHAAEVWKRHHNVYALQNVTVCLSGETLVVVGVNGSGKTTLLRCLVGELFPSYGNIFVNGFCATRSNWLRFAAKSLLGYATESLVLQHTTLTPYLFLGIMADLRMLRRDKSRKQHLFYLMRTLGIEPYMHIAISLLNVSLQRRVGLAAALVGYPPVLILDDVTGTLDPLARRQVWAAIKSAPQGTTTVFSTKNPDDVEMVGDRMLLLDEGTMRFIGTPARWRSKYRDGLYVSIDVSRSQEGLVYNTSHSARERELLQKYFTACWQDSTLIDSRPFHYVFHIPHCTPEEALATHSMGTDSQSNTETVTLSSQKRTLHVVLASLVRGRSNGWVVPGDNKRDVDIGVYTDYFPCSITVSETRIEHTMMAALSESVAFKTSARKLYDKNVYITPKNDFPVL